MLKRFISLLVIFSMLWLDGVRVVQAMEDTEQQQNLQKNFNPRSDQKNPIKVIKKPKLRRSSLNLSEAIKRAPLEKKSQSPLKSSESKESSFDSTTISPRNLSNLEDASSSPEKNSPSSSDEFISFAGQQTNKFKVKRASLDLSEARKRSPLKTENQSIHINVENSIKPPFITLNLEENTQKSKKVSENFSGGMNLKTQSSMFKEGNTFYIFETQEKRKDKYTEKTPLLIDQKAQETQKKPTFPFKSDNNSKRTEELKILNRESINNNGTEYSNFGEEIETVSQEDHKDKKKKWSSDSIDDFDFTLITDIDKRGCCCNRPCLPHPDLYWLKVSDLQNVIEISEEDKLEEKKDLPHTKIINLPNVTENFKVKKNSQPSIISSVMIVEDGEKDLNSSSYIEKLKKFDFKQLSAHTKTQLNFLVREMEGPWPKWEWIKNKQWGKLWEWAKNELPGSAIGTGVGVWLSKAMVPVYLSAGDYLVMNFVFAYEKPWKGIITLVQEHTKPYVIPSIIVDSIPRNVVLWRKSLTLLKEEKLSKKRVFWTAAASFFPSLLEPSYLILLDLELIGIANSEGGNSAPYKKDILKYTWPLFIDSWTSNFQTTWNMWDDFQEWRQTTSIGCLRSSYIPSEEESLCRNFKKKLDKVSKWLYRTASSEQIKTVYEKLKRSEAEVGELFPNLNKEDLPNARAFLGLNELIVLGDDLEQTQRYIKSWYDIGADILTDFCLVTGSPARLLTLQLIISSMTNLIPMPSWLRYPLNWGLAGAGFIPQTALEHQGLSTFSKEFLAQEEADGEAIYKNAKTIGGFRVSGKAYALWQGFIFTLPLVVTVFQVVNNWSTTQPGNPYWMIGAVTFLFAEYATQVSKQWNWSFQKWVSLGSTLYNNIRNKCSRSSSTQHQRAYILGFIENAKDRMPYFTPELLHILKGNLNYKNELEKEEEN